MKKLLILCTLGLLILGACDDDDGDGPAAIETAALSPTEPPPTGETETATAAPTEPPAATPTETATEPPSDDAGEAQTITLDARGLSLYTVDGAILEQFAGDDILGNRGGGLDWFPAGDGVGAMGTNIIATSSISGDSEVITELQDLAFGLSVSPDGSRIAYGCLDDICVVDAVAGSEPENLTNDDLSDTLLTWLDDDRILFLSERREGGSNVDLKRGHPPVGAYFVLDTADGAIAPATEADVAEPHISPEGEWRFVVEPAEDGVRVVLEGLDGPSDDMYIEVPVEQPPAGLDPPDVQLLDSYYSVAWSNGDIYAAVVQQSVVDNTSVYKVWLADLNASSLRLIIDTEGCPGLPCFLNVDWSPDSSQLALLYGAVGD